MNTILRQPKYMNHSTLPVFNWESADIRGGMSE